ncbi:TetR/AcrR family transcriptional regulator [Pseudomonas japonica]|uniref:TetR/AcrR family transcriptional regulator n=1 Tax=Pseudomonas japonica TaxID=256466 RepID=UPI003810254C
MRSEKIVRTNNRRGQRSREEILDVASRLMAQQGYAATSLSTLSSETGLPKSAIYHHFESKAGLLSAVMLHNAERFFAALAEAYAHPPGGGTAHERLSWHLKRTGEVFMAHPDFLRLHLILIMSAEAKEAEVDALIAQVRLEGRAHMHSMISSSFAAYGEEVAQVIADKLTYFAIAGFDGAFVAMQADPQRHLAAQMPQLAQAMVVLGEIYAAELRGDA